MIISCFAMANPYLRQKLQPEAGVNFCRQYQNKNDTASWFFVLIFYTI